MHVVSFYEFTHVQDSTNSAAELRKQFEKLGVVGTALIAKEGINATLAHSELGLLERAVALVRSKLNLPTLRAKYSTARSDNPVFYRLKVKDRDEIIQFGKSMSPTDRTGIHVSASKWNELLVDPDVVVLDVRNDYEIEAGKFESAVPIGINRFREFDGRVAELLRQHGKSSVAMYCTGGIRCEKASNALLESGCETVYQLDGGILGYLETVDASKNEWQGECFVFDQRVSVNANLTQGSYEQCHACRRPISESDMQSEMYVKSVSCPYCFHETTEQQKAQFAERAKQEELASSRGARHVGVPQS